MLVCDGLKGLPMRSSAVWEKTSCEAASSICCGTLQVRIGRDWAQIANDLKPIYTAASKADALDRFAEFSGKWEKRYPPIIRLWRTPRPNSSLPAPSTGIRTVICTTNAIESIKARFRRWVKARDHFPTEQAALKRLYLAVVSLDPRQGAPAMDQGGRPP